MRLRTAPDDVRRASPLRRQQRVQRLSRLLDSGHDVLLLELERQHPFHELVRDELLLVLEAGVLRERGEKMGSSGHQGEPCASIPLAARLAGWYDPAAFVAQANKQLPRSDWEGRWGRARTVSTDSSLSRFTSSVRLLHRLFSRSNYRAQTVT